MKEKRRQKLKSIVYAMRELNNFSTDDAKLVCHDSAPSYVTRTINQLVKNGFLDQYRVAGIEDKHYDGSITNSINWISGSSNRSMANRSKKLQNRIATRNFASYGFGQADAGESPCHPNSNRHPRESCVQAARLLSNRFASRLHELPEAGLNELKEISRAIRKDSYCQIMAGIELGRRIA